MVFTIGSLLALAQPALVQPDDTWLPASSGNGFRMLLASLVVLGLFGSVGVADATRRVYEAATGRRHDRNSRASG